MKKGVIIYLTKKKHIRDLKISGGIEGGGGQQRGGIGGRSSTKGRIALGDDCTTHQKQVHLSDKKIKYSKYCRNLALRVG